MEKRKEILISLQDGRTETDSSLRLPLRVVDREIEGVGRSLSQSQSQVSLPPFEKAPRCVQTARRRRSVSARARGIARAVRKWVLDAVN